MSIGAGLLSTLQVGSGHAKWIGYQVIFGVGVGFGLQAAFSAAQTALELAGVPIGIAIIVFSENMAAAHMVSVAETVFTNQLTKDLVQYLPSIDPSVLVPCVSVKGKKTNAPPSIDLHSSFHLLDTP